MTIQWRLWLSRVLIGVVFGWNVQCALVFILWPEAYTPGFELQGIAGTAMLRGMGVLFLMWNVPYAVALWNPLRHRVSLYQAVTMQAIGLAGETLLLVTLPGDHALLRASTQRFIYFDGAGLVLLLVAAWVVWKCKSNNPG
jgi:hypothetical protein